ncbi:VCBS repeat-containing protein, partial [Deltaproteobacteria bacterium]|nr:VCBS repeat-containing protein [Deltaproteobacteria bacterium]
NIYVTGSFSGSLPFVATTQTASGTTDVFVAKYSSSGGQLSFYSAGGTGSQSVGYSISVSSNGDVHVCGKFTGTSTFGSNSVSSNGGFDMFKATLSSSGSWSSILSAGGTGDDDAHVISVDSSGNSYITGSFENSFTLVGTTFTSNGNKDIFVAKLNNSNSWVWMTTAGGSGDDKGTGIDFDSNGNAFVTGVMSGSVTIAGTTLTSNGLSDAFIGQISSSGSWVWVNNGGSSSTDKMYDISVDSNGFGYAGGYIAGDAEIGIQNLTCSSTCAIMIKTPVVQSSAADGNISVNLEFDYTNTRLKGNWTASDLVTGHDYNVSWTLKYQNNGTQISNGWPDSFYPQSTSHSSPSSRTWSSGYEGGKLVCYEVELRDGDGFSGPILDTATSCIRTPVELSELTSSDVSNAVQRSSAGNCVINSGNNQGNACDNNTGSNWVSADNYDPYDLMIDFDLGTTAVKVNAVAAYVNNPNYLSTIKNVRLQYLNETGDYVDIGIFQIDRATGWQYFGGFSVTTTEIRWDVLSNHGYTHTVLFEGKVLDIPDIIFNSNGDWNSSISLWTYSVAWGDVDSDGDLDLAVGNADDSYGPTEVYSNGGSALASSRSWVSVSNLDTRSVSWGDVDNDGDLDLAVGNLGDQNEIYLNTGTGLATTPTWTSTNSLQTYSIAWGDVDGDGDLDLAVGNNQANNEVYINSNGEFATSADWTSENSLNTRVVVWVDVDSDGDLDLSVGNANGNNEIYINSGTSLATTPDWTSSNSLSTSSVAWGDIDDDGHLDMVVANDGGSNELYLSNNGVLATTSAWTSSNSLNSKSIALGDVDGDGDLDMAVGNYNQNNEVYLYSNGAFTTTPAWTGALTQKTFSVAWGDVDGDGDLDLAIGEQQSKNQVYLNQLDSGGAGADGLPDIDLGGPQPIFNSTADWTSSNSLYGHSVALGDVDGDGDLDMAVGNYGSNIQMYLNSGTTFTTTPDWTSSGSMDTTSVVWGDVDGDGDLDLAVGNNGAN